MNSDVQDSSFKVVLIFNLKPGTADEELRRSGLDDSFPRKLSRQPGFESMDLVKLDDQQTMSIQSWETPQAWWKALETVKSSQEEGDEDQESILVSRDFYAGSVVSRIF